MDAKLKQRWVEALRSGKYKQGKGALKETQAGQGTPFCCLGVLCDIEGIPYHDRHSESVPTYGYVFPGGVIANDLPSGPMYETVGYLGTPNGEESATLLLADMNDNGDSFETIADWIEEHL